MPGKMLASSCWRKRAMRLSRSSSFTRRVRRRSSEKVLRRNSPSVRGRDIKPPRQTFINYTRKSGLRVWSGLTRKIKIFTTEGTGVHGVSLCRTESRPFSVDVAVASGLLSGTGGATDVGEDGFEIADEQGQTFWLRAQGEQLLFEIEVKGHGSGKLEGEQRGSGGGDLLFGASDREQLGVELNCALGVYLRRRSGFVIDHENFGLEKRPLLVDADEFESLAAFGDQVEAAVRIFFYDGDDFGGAA